MGFHFFEPPCNIQSTGRIYPSRCNMAKSKCKLLQLTFVSGIIFENQSSEKRADLRQLVPSKERRISPDGNCLFRSLSFVLTGTDRFHKDIRDFLVENMKSAYRETCTNYCHSHYELLPENRCHSMEDYLAKSRMESSGSWGQIWNSF